MRAAPSVAQAEAALARLVALLRPFGRVAAGSVQEYWKVPNNHEVFLNLYPDARIKPAFDAVLETLGGNWLAEGTEGEDLW